MAHVPAERQLTRSPFPTNLDNNINFSPDGRLVVADTRDDGGINTNKRLVTVDVRTGAVDPFYTLETGLLGVGAASYLNDHEVVAIHALETGQKYDFTMRGGMIIATDGSRKRRWLDSRSVLPPFTPGALRGGTHKHEPDASGQWVGFTYNDAVMKARGSDLRNVGVSRRGMRVEVPADSGGGAFVGESFTVLLTACVDAPKPGSDEYGRAEGDCWVGRDGYEMAGGRRQRARAFRGVVTALEDGATKAYSEVYVVDVPDDLTQPGPGGPLQGTEATHPAPPAGARVRRLTHTARAADHAMRGVKGHLRASGDGRWIACIAPVRRGGGVVDEVHLVDPASGAMRRLSRLPEGVAGDARFDALSRFVAVGCPDGSVAMIDARKERWGSATLIAPAGPTPSNIVLSPDGSLAVYNRTVAGVQQVFCAETGY
jgi:hypothetical protein